MNTNDHSISPLPQRVQPLPWEDLGSFLTRTARHMGYETTAWLLQPETIPYQIDTSDLSTLSKQTDYDFLSHLLLLSEKTLYHLTLHHLSPILDDHPPFVEAEARKLRRSTHSIDQKILSKNKLDDFCFFSPNIRFCPACFSETTAYDRLYWRLKHLVTCPYHGMILQTYCAVCFKKIPSLRTFITHCPSCRQPLRQDTKTINVQTHPAFSFLLQGDLLTLKVLGHQEKKIDQSMLPLQHDPRATLPPEQYFPLLRVICTSIKALDEADLFTFLPPPVYELLTLLERSHHVSTKRSPQVQVAITHWLFASWPDRFFAFLDTIYYRNKHPNSLFRHFPWRQLPTYTEAFHLLHQLHAQYRALYEKLGFDALHARVQQRLFAFNEELSLPFFPSLPQQTRAQDAQKGELFRMQMRGQGISPLPSLVEPLPWEDLHSFLARTAKRMQYAKAAQILQPQTDAYHIETYEVSLLTEQSDYDFLSNLLLLNEEALYQMTLHRFCSVFRQLDFFPTVKPPWKNEQCLKPRATPYRSPIQRPRLEKGLLRHFFLPNQTTQICPLCLEDPVAYDRLYWKARHLLTCPQHAIRLQRHCATCQQRIPSSRLDASSCPFCHRSYQAPSSMISPIPPEASYLLHGDLLTLHALGVTQVPIHPAFPPAKPDPREHLPPAQYFALLRAICLSLHPLRAAHFQSFLPPALYDSLTKNQITPSHSDHVPSLHIAASHWIFTAWPDHFFTYLDTLEQWSWQVKKPHAFSSFPQRFLLGSKAQEAYAFLSHAYRAYQTSSRS